MRFEKQAAKIYQSLMPEEKEGKIVYYKKRRTYPALNQDGSINWFNALTGGSWFNLLFLLFIVAIALGVVWEYHTNLGECAKLMTNLNMMKINKTALFSGDLSWLNNSIVKYPLP